MLARTLTREGHVLEIEDEELRRFHVWLQAKGNDPTAILARWWIDEFEEAEKEETYPEEPAPTIH